jgi:hypothetical protein
MSSALAPILIDPTRHGRAKEKLNNHAGEKETMKCLKQTVCMEFLVTIPAVSKSD